LHQVEGIELADQPQHEATWGLRMGGKGEPHLAGRHRSGIPRDVFHLFPGQVAVFELGESAIFRQRGIGCSQDIGRFWS